MLERASGKGKGRAASPLEKEGPIGDRPSVRAPRQSAYFAAISARVVSSMRLLKPHSLSYQLSTFTRVPPITRV